MRLSKLYLHAIVNLLCFSSLVAQVQTFDFKSFNPKKETEIHVVDGVFASNGDLFVVSYESWPWEYTIVHLDASGVPIEELSIKEVEHNGKTYNIRDVRAFENGFLGYWLTMDKKANQTYGIYAEISVENGLNIGDFKEIPVINYQNNRIPLCRTDYPWALGDGARYGGLMSANDVNRSRSGKYNLLTWFSDKNQYVKGSWDEFGFSASVLDKELNYLYKVEIPLADNDNESMIVQQVIMGDDGKVYMLYSYKEAKNKWDWKTRLDYLLVRFDKDKVDRWKLIKGSDSEPSSIELYMENDSTCYLASHNLMTDGQADPHTAIYIFYLDQLDQSTYMTEQIKTANIKYHRLEPKEDPTKIRIQSISYNHDGYQEYDNQQDVGGLFKTSQGIILNEVLFTRWAGASGEYAGYTYIQGYFGVQNYGPIRFSLLKDNELMVDNTVLDQELWSKFDQRMIVEPWGDGLLVFYQDGIPPEDLEKRLNKKKKYYDQVEVRWQLSELRMAVVDGAGKLIRDELLLEPKEGQYYIPGQNFFNADKTKMCFKTWDRSGMIKLNIIDLGEAP